MKNNVSRLFKIILPVALCFASVSCKNAFDLEPKNIVEAKNAYQNLSDADAALMGLYGKFQLLADRFVVLNELRADLADVTPNADKYLKELNNHAVTVDNYYADPRPFYAVIIDCNDVLKNYDSMLQQNRITKAEYDLRYSDVGALRSWVYLQVGIQYGSVPYVTEPITNIEELTDESKFPVLSFDALLDKLIAFSETLPYKEQPTTGGSISLAPDPKGVIGTAVYDSYNVSKFFIFKKLLLGDLYLWKGDYGKASFNYKYVMEYSGILNPALNGESYYITYRVTYSALNGSAWGDMFKQPFEGIQANYENIWQLPYDKSFDPKNPFIKLFNNTGTGQYLIKPSDLAIKNWTTGIRNDGTPGDLRGINNSYKVVNGKPIINKFSPNYVATSPFETNSKWIIYRAGMLHLRVSEAANRDGRDKLAYTFMNSPFQNVYDYAPFGPDAKNNVNSMQSFDSQPYYYYDGRQGTNAYFRSPWYRHTGLRNRVSMPAAKVDSTLYFDMSIPGNANKAVTNRPGLTLAMEDLLIKESALELAFEGNRWEDLLRIALRREKIDGTGKAFLADKISAKFTAAGLPVPTGVTALGSDTKNWYLPFKWK